MSQRDTNAGKSSGGRKRPMSSVVLAGVFILALLVALVFFWMPGTVDEGQTTVPPATEPVTETAPALEAPAATPMETPAEPTTQPEATTEPATEPAVNP